MPRTRYLRLGATRSLGQLCWRQRLQISDDVVLALVQIAFDRTRMRGWREEALRALNTLEVHDSGVLADRLVELLAGSDAEKLCAWEGIKAMHSCRNDLISCTAIPPRPTPSLPYAHPVPPQR